MVSLLAEFTTGAVFGVALLVAGISSPTIITEQMMLRDQTMLCTYLVAGALSAILIYVADRIGYMAVSVRVPKTLGFSPFDANLVGGALQGVGMAMCASCPASVMVQMGLSLRGSLFTGIGCLLGGLLYIQLAPHLQARVDQSERAGTQMSTPAVPRTVQHAIKINYSLAVVAFSITVLGILKAHESYTDPLQSSWQQALKRGIYIGAAQCLSILICRHSIGVSTCFEHMARAVLRLHSTPGKILTELGTPAVSFAAGMVSSSFIIALFSTSLAHYPSLHSINRVLALTGGALMAFGSRLAGGCTSGHSISGIGSLSLSSFITTASMYAGGMLTARIL